MNEKIKKAQSDAARILGAKGLKEINRRYTKEELSKIRSKAAIKRWKNAKKKKK